MKKILNAPSACVDEMPAGLCAACPAIYRLADERAVARTGGAGDNHMTGDQT